jgi:hypothetical protein
MRTKDTSHTHRHKRREKAAVADIKFPPIDFDFQLAIIIFTTLPV